MKKKNPLYYDLTNLSDDWFETRQLKRYKKRYPRKRELKKFAPNLDIYVESVDLFTAADKEGLTRVKNRGLILDRFARLLETFLKDQPRDVLDRITKSFHKQKDGSKPFARKFITEGSFLPGESWFKFFAITLQLKPWILESKLHAPTQLNILILDEDAFMDYSRTCMRTLEMYNYTASDQEIAKQGIQALYEAFRPTFKLFKEKKTPKSLIVGYIAANVFSHQFTPYMMMHEIAEIANLFRKPSHLGNFKYSEMQWMADNFFPILKNTSLQVRMWRTALARREGAVILFQHFLTKGRLTLTNTVHKYSPIAREVLDYISEVHENASYEEWMESKGLEKPKDRLDRILQFKEYKYEMMPYSDIERLLTSALHLEEERTYTLENLQEKLDILNEEFTKIQQMLLDIDYPIFIYA